VFITSNVSGSELLSLSASKLLQSLASELTFSNTIADVKGPGTLAMLLLFCKEHNRQEKRDGAS
jgi:hypothetical protein